MLQGVVQRLLGDPEHLALQGGGQLDSAVFEESGLDAGALLDGFQPVAQRANQPFLL